MKTHVRVRPHDGEKSIWVVDVYDGRGVRQSSSYGPCDMTKKRGFQKGRHNQKENEKGQQLYWHCLQCGAYDPIEEPTGGTEAASLVTWLWPVTGANRGA